MGTGVIIPSYQNGFAPRDGEPIYPGSRKGLVFNWHGPLGVTGTTAFDTSGYDNDGTLTNMDPAADWVMTANGWALDFGGKDSGNYIQLFRKISMGAVPYTFSCWADIDNFDEYSGFWGNEYAAGLYSRLVISKTSGDVLWSTDANQFKIFANGCLTGRHHYAFVCDGTNWIVYRDGVLFGSQVREIDTTTFYRLGSYGVAGAFGDSLDGRLDSVAIHDRALTLSEIQLLYRDEHALTRLADRRVVATTGGAPPAGTPWLYARLGSRVIGAA